MQQYSVQDLNDLLEADNAIVSFMEESTTEGEEYLELEKFVSDLGIEY